MRLDEVLQQFMLDCEIRGRTPLTLKWYRQRLLFFIQTVEQSYGVVELEQVTIGHLRQFVQLLMNTKVNSTHPRKHVQEKKLSPTTVRGYVRVLKVFFSWCLHEDLIDTNPALRVAQPKAPDNLVPTFTAEHIEAMLATCDQKTRVGFRNYVMLLLLLDTGMRVSEICGLRVVDVHDRYVKVLGKGRKEREIGLHPEVSKLLWKYVHKHRKPAYPDESALFLGRGGKPLSVSGFEGTVQRIKQRSGLEGMKVSPHVFRHTFAKWYLERGGELFKLSREMGHSRVQVTETYLKDFTSTEARKEHSEYSPIGSINLRKKGPVKSSKRK
jgi:integrase/recombinase XerD